MLTDRRSELLDDLVRQHLSSRAEAGRTGEVTRAAALLNIAAQDAGDSIVTMVFEAIGDPADFLEPLDATAHDTTRALTLLEPLATIALTAATTEPKAAVAVLYLAISAAVTGDQVRATELVSRALTWDPSSVSAWIAQLARLGAVQPSVLALITVLAEARHDGEH